MRAALLASTFLCAVAMGAPLFQAAFGAQSHVEELVPVTADTEAPASRAKAPAFPDIEQQVPVPNFSSTGAPPPISVDDAQRRQALQKLISDRLDRSTDRKEDRAAVGEFYRQRDFLPIWTVDGAPTGQANGAIYHLRNAARDGLDPADYPGPEFPAFLAADVAAEADLRLTLSLLKYTRHVSSGRVSYTRVSESILYPSRPFDPATVLRALAEAKDVEVTLTGFEPQQPQYRALKAQLENELRGPAPKQDGKGNRADLIVANMERWRWLPRELGTSYVMVNIPQYSLQLVDKGSSVWTTKIVVGQPGNKATPLLSETMKYLTVNPTWNVPPSIIRNEYLPALERDSGALERIGMKVGRNQDGSVRVYQPPGPKNALGRIRFNFPNPFLVYQHDTPNKKLFALEKRALSHGCMRVQDPDKYAEALLSVSQPKDGMTAAHIRDLYGDEERTINLRRPIPVHITYQTAVVDDTGHLVQRNDIYGLDAAIIKLMRGSARAVADKAVPRNYHSSSKPVMAGPPASVPEFGARQKFVGINDHAQQPFGQPGATFFDRAVGTW